MPSGLGLVDGAQTVAALYVEANGPYAGLEGVDCWPESRDARRYAGPNPVVAHPPCNRWCSIAPINVELRAGSLSVTMAECSRALWIAFAASVAFWSTQLEHTLGRAYGLPSPPRYGGLD